MSSFCDGGDELACQFALPRTKMSSSPYCRATNDRLAAETAAAPYTPPRSYVSTLSHSRGKNLKNAYLVGGVESDAQVLGALWCNQHEGIQGTLAPERGVSAILLHALGFPSYAGRVRVLNVCPAHVPVRNVEYVGERLVVCAQSERGPWVHVFRCESLLGLHSDAVERRCAKVRRVGPSLLRQRVPESIRNWAARRRHVSRPTAHIEEEEEEASPDEIPTEEAHSLGHRNGAWVSDLQIAQLEQRVGQGLDKLVAPQDALSRTHAII